MNTNKRRVTLCLTACAMLISLNTLANINTNPPPPPPATVDNAEKIAVKPRGGISQEKRIKGNIKDQEGENIIGAMVIENNNKSNGTVTDVDGNFSLKVPSDAIITISYMGFKTQEVNTSGKTNFNIILEDDITAAEEVVVVGYGTQKKQNLTGAVSQVNMEKVLGDRPVTSVAAALQGAIPGLTITGGSIPGASKTINIRGTTSINGGSPLILIDNVPGDLDMLNPEDIQSVSVLKDAASAAIYGARGAFGVILITTKKAKNNSRISINYNNNFGFQKPSDQLEQPDMITILETMQDWDNDNVAHAQSQDYDKWIGYINDYRSGTLMDKYPDAYFENGRFIAPGDDIYYYLEPTNPQEAVFDNYGFQQTHNLSASGGSEKISYRISLGYTDNDGPLKTDKDFYSRISVSSYVDAKITKWMTTSLDMKYAKSNRSYVENGEIWSGIYRPSWYPNGELSDSKDPNGQAYPTMFPLNYLELTDPSLWNMETPRVFSRTVFTPIKGLDAVVEYTFDKRNSSKRKNVNSELMINDEMVVQNLNNNPSYRIDKTSIAYNSLNIYTTYSKSLNELHNFKIMVGYNQDSRDYESNWTDRKELINPNMPSISGGTGELTAGDSYSQYSIRSGFFRFNYNYDEKYLFEANGRYDGSSKFPKETRYGLFPSVSAGWNITNESFMDEVEWINELKPRASWGQLGNQSIGAYAFYPQMTSRLAGWIVDSSKPVTLNMPGLISGDFTWEIVETLDIGVDFSFLNNRLSGVFDWYVRDTKGMLAPGSEIPSTAGTNAPKQNVADLRTKGWELAMQWRDNIEEWRYSIGFNIYDSRTVITKYDNEVGRFGTISGSSQALNNLYLREGMEVGEIWGYVSDGFYTIDDFDLEKAKIGLWQLKEGVTGIKGKDGDIRPGDAKFKNSSDWQEGYDNMIDDGKDTESISGDRQIIGNNRARYNFGVNGSIGWKGFDFSFLLQGTGKRDYWYGGDIRFPMTRDYNTSVYSHQLNYWNPISTNPSSPDFYRAENPNAEFGRIYGENINRNSNNRVQTKYLLDASYVRLKNVTLSYSIPKSVTTKIGLQRAKVFFSGENLATFSNLPQGVDPERLSWGYPFFATYSFGISLTL